MDNNLNDPLIEYERALANTDPMVLRVVAQIVRERDKLFAENRELKNRLRYLAGDEVVSLHELHSAEVSHVPIGG